MAKFANTVDYVPAIASFEAVDPDLLKLLVKPLYGGDPYMGIRELLQNSVDACRERDDILTHLAPTASIRADRAEADVLLSFDGDDQNGWVLTVTDSGVGMTAETLLRYFLRVGGTYRNSEEWKRMHTTDGLGRKSRVLRSGRFGIGVLAAFLLGDLLRVRTRHLLAPEHCAVTFEATLDTAEVELRKTSCPAGTTIQIPLPAEVSSKLLVMNVMNENPQQPGSRYRGLDRSKRIYFLKEPSVRVHINGKPVSMGEAWPSEGAELPAPWHRLRIPDFADTHWCSSAERRSSTLVLNGIALTNGYSVSELWDCKGGFHPHAPSVSIFDRNGASNITLDRKGLVNGTLPFDRELLEDVIRDILAALLLSPEEIGWGRFDCPGVWMQLAFSKEGFSALHPAFLPRRSSWQVLEVESQRPDFGRWEEIVDLLPRSRRACLAPGFFVRAKGEEYLAAARDQPHWGTDLHVERVRMFVPLKVLKHWSSLKTRTVKPLLGLKVEKRGKRWVSLAYQPGIPALVDVSQLETVLEEHDRIATEYRVSAPAEASDREHPLWNLVRRCLGRQLWIPMELSARRKRLPRAFRELKPYMDVHLKSRPPSV